MIRFRSADQYVYENKRCICAFVWKHHWECVIMRASAPAFSGMARLTPSVCVCVCVCVCGGGGGEGQGDRGGGRRGVSRVCAGVGGVWGGGGGACVWESVGGWGGGGGCVCVWGCVCVGGG